MIQNNSELQKHKQVQVRSLFDTTTFGKFEPLSSAFESFEGKNPYCAIMDEYHALEGKLKGEGLFAINYTLDVGDNWQDLIYWIKSNPNLNVSVYDVKLKDLFQIEKIYDIAYRHKKNPAMNRVCIFSGIR